MKLSSTAKEELLKILIQEIGLEKAKKLSQEEMECLGIFLLTIFAEGLKLRKTM